MGFINWWQNNKDETDSQLSLLGDSQPLTRSERVDGATVFKDFSQAVQDAGGSSRSYARAVREETKALFDCGVDELYEETGGRKGDRSTLPKEAQKAYLVSETLATHQINQAQPNLVDQSQQMRDDAVVETVKQTATEVRKWLPW